MSNQQEVLLKRIKETQARINTYVVQAEPRGVRLTNTGIICGAIATVLTAGPAMGGNALTNLFGKGSWQFFCLAAMLCSLASTIATALHKSHDMSTRVAKAQACNVNLEGLETLLEVGQIPVEKAVELYNHYIAEIPFVPDMPAKNG